MAKLSQLLGSSFQGTQGLQGRQGLQGSLSNFQGTQGRQGLQGLQGNQSVQGTQGRQGLQGNQGLQGSQGRQGLQGLQGSQGRQGLQGTQGLQGIDGTSQWTPVLSSNFMRVVNGNTFIKFNGTNNFNESVYSHEGYSRGVFVSCKLLQTNASIAVGLSTNPAGSSDLNNIDYCWLPDSLGQLSIYEKGTIVGSGGAFGTYNTNTELSIIHNGYTISYYKDGVGVKTTFREIGLPLYLDSSFATPQGQLTSVGFGPIGETIQGNQGLQGSQGRQGLQGLQGLQSTQGNQGLQGRQGLQGSLSNFQGTQGLQGLQGSLSNFQGTQGLQGSQGLKVQGTSGSDDVSVVILAMLF